MTYPDMPTTTLVQEAFRLAPAQPAPLPMPVAHDPREGNNVKDVIALGKRHGWTFWEMQHQGIPEGTVTHDNIRYRVLEDNDSRPDWVRQRIQTVAAEVPGVTFLYGEEIELNQVRVLERKLKQASEQAAKVIKALAIAAGAVIAVVALASVITTLLTIGAIVLAVGGLASLAVVDPQIVCVVGEEERWVSLAVWYD